MIEKVIVFALVATIYSRTRCQNGKHWEEECATCTCKGGKPKCVQKEKCEKSISCEEGTEWMNKCNKCTCLKNGHVDCTANNCCKSHINGITTYPAPDTTFTDGCNTCACGKDGTIEWCTRSFCATKCSFYNWEGAFGHADAMTGLQAFDDEDNCNKICECSGDYTIKCPAGKEHCVVH